jgi:hypothetical protein
VTSPFAATFDQRRRRRGRAHPAKTDILPHRRRAPPPNADFASPRREPAPWVRARFVGIDTDALAISTAARTTRAPFTKARRQRPALR